MLDDTLKSQLAAYLERVTQPFELVATLGDDDNSRQMLDLLQTIQSLRADKITLRTDGTDARKPSFALQRMGSPNSLRFAGLPLGHEFTSLVLALLWTGGHPPKVARVHISRQLLVVQPHAVHIAGFGARGIQHKGRARLQHHLALGELANPDLRSLKVGHDGHFATRAFGRLAHQVGAVNVVLRLAVAEIEPNHVDAAGDHGHQQGGIAGSGSEGGNDLGGAMGHGGQFQIERD